MSKDLMDMELWPWIVLLVVTVVMTTVAEVVDKFEILQVIEQGADGRRRLRHRLRARWGGSCREAAVSLAKGILLSLSLTIPAAMALAVAACGVVYEWRLVANLELP